MHNVSVKGSIKLDQFLKWAGVTNSGGEAKLMIQSGQVSVNGEEVHSRGRMLTDGDVVSVRNAGEYRVVYLAVQKE